MSAPNDMNKSSTESAPESPTTARPFELDDDDIQDSSMLADDTTTPATAPTAAQPTPGSVDGAPPKPPRPVSEAQQNVVILKEAFPSVDQSVIKAVLSASGGRVEPAFNALLEMTDPEAAKLEPAEAAPPPQPPRPQGRREMSQLEADELYARQLAEQYDNAGAYESRTSSRRQTQRSAQPAHDEDDRDYNFIEDELPVIRENIRKGFVETQTVVNGWISGIRKKLEESFDESGEGQGGQSQPVRRQGEQSRRSGDYDRYDADPQVLSDDFANIRLNPDGSRQTGPNPGMYRPPPASSPRPSGERRVGFKEETEEINMYDSSPKVPPKDVTPGSGSKASKWQPLSTMEPSPITDNDPFSLGDSEDEKEIKEKPKDGKLDDSERLKQAAAEAMADSLVDQGKDGAAKKA